MDKLILNSIIEITRQRDMDALEQALIRSLAQLVPAKTISLYRSLNGSLNSNLDGVLQTSVSINNNELDFSNERKLTAVNGHLIECLKSASIVKHENQGRLMQIFYPVFIDKKVAGAIHIESQNDITSCDKLIEPLMHIYSNHLTVLNESERDKLTGLLNRRTFDNRLNKLLDNQRSQQESYIKENKNEKRRYTPEFSSWLAMLDIDHFKDINDNHGHLFGDEVILILSQQMRHFFRHTDLLFRFGGEEFVIILEPTTPNEAKQTFERFGQVIAEYKFPQIDKITISTGYARITNNDYPHVILERADRALYYAKESGRNCVHNYETLVDEGLIAERKSTESTTLF